MSTTKIIEAARKLGIVSETKLRNMKIRNEFHKLRRKIKYEAAIALLSESYFLSESSIAQIVRQNKGVAAHG